MTTGWEEFSAIAVACSTVATAGMALYTARLAKKTAALSIAAEKEANAVVEQGAAIRVQAEAVSNQAASASEQLELTRQSLQASVQPWLTLGNREPDAEINFVGSIVTEPGRVALHLTGDEQHFNVDLAVRNVGAGLAIIDPKASHVVSWPDPRNETWDLMNFSSGSVTNPVVLSGEQVRLFFAVDLSRWMTDLKTITGQHRNDGEFWIDVVYGASIGAEKTRARFHAAFQKHSTEWIIFEIEYFTPPDETAPGVSVRF